MKNIELKVIPANKELKVGDIFGMSADNLRTLIVFDGDLSDLDEGCIEREKNFEKRISTVLQKDMKYLENKYLVFKYLGDGKCQEYYTSKIVNIISFGSHGIEDSYSEMSAIKFMKNYNSMKENPLAICIEPSLDGKIYEVDDMFKLAFANQNMWHEDEIIFEINKLEEYGKKQLQSSFMKSVDFDKKMAYTENAIYDLQKTRKHI